MNILQRSRHLARCGLVRNPRCLFSKINGEPDGRHSEVSPQDDLFTDERFRMYDKHDAIIDINELR